MKIFFYHIFFCSLNFTKLKIIKFLKKKIWASFQRIRELFTQKFVTNLTKICVWTREKTYSGSRIRIQGSKRHRIPDPDPQHCLQPIVTTILECVTLLCRRPKIIAGRHLNIFFACTSLFTFKFWLCFISMEFGTWHPAQQQMCSSSSPRNP